MFPLLLTTVHTVKSKGKILKIFVAFSEYMNFTNLFSVQYSKITVWLGSTALLARDYWDRKRKKNSWQLTKKTSVVQCINSSQLQYPLCIYNLPMIIAAIIHRYVSPDFLPFSCSCFQKLIHNGLKSFQDSQPCLDIV